jgi:voltage-gated potassium channel
MQDQPGIKSETNLNIPGKVDASIAEQSKQPVDIYRSDRQGSYSRIKQQVHTLLYPEDKGTIWSRLVNILIVTLVIVTVVTVILETVESIYNKYNDLFITIELFTISVFTIEYLLRVWSCTALEKYRHPIKGRLRYMFSVGSVVDLLAILPFYLPLILGMDLRFIMTLRLLRFLRLLKLGRYMQASLKLVRIVQKKKEELILSFSLTLLLIIISSSLMYTIEHAAQPGTFSSIPHTMWWAVSTLTTVGYGDIIPVTAMGKMLTGIISLLGVGLFALPTGILVSGFASEFNKESAGKKCPHCGKEID